MTLSLTILDWVVLSSIMVGSLSFGLYMAYLKKAGQNSANLFLGGRLIKWPIIGASLFATNIGAEHLVGLSGDSYRYGLSAGSVELTCAITLGFGCTCYFSDCGVEFCFHACCAWFYCRVSSGRFWKKTGHIWSLYHDDCDFVRDWSSLSCL